MSEKHSQPVSYEYTEEEKRVMQECRVESFWYRCVPLGMLFVGTSQILVNRGLVRRNPKYGALFKNLGAAGVGYIVGKMSYLSVCREKLIKLENSPIADSLRKGRFVSQINPRYDPGVQPKSDSNSFQMKEDYTSSSDIDTEQSELKGLDDNFRPNMDSDSGKPVKNTETRKSFTNYEDLRQQNRIEFSKRNQPQGAPPPPSSLDNSTRYKAATGSDDSRPYKKIKRNQYGDIVED